MAKKAPQEAEIVEAAPATETPEQTEVVAQPVATSTPSYDALVSQNRTLKTVTAVLAGVILMIGMCVMVSAIVEHKTDSRYDDNRSTNYGPMMQRR